MRWYWVLIALPTVFAGGALFALAQHACPEPTQAAPIALLYPDCLVCSTAERLGIRMTGFPEQQTVG